MINPANQFLAALAAFLIAAGACCWAQPTTDPAPAADQQPIDPLLPDQTDPPSTLDELAHLALSRDEMINMLKARQAELELRKAQAEMDRAELDLRDTRSLFDENIVTVNELRKAEQSSKEAQIRHAQAEVRLRQTKLEFLKNATLIRVVNAEKFRGPDNDVIARIELQNDSDINKARVVMADPRQPGQVDDQQLAALLKVNNVIVTLWGSSVTLAAETRLHITEAIIGDPFQQIIPELPLGARLPLEFRLLKKETEHVTVELEYLETTRKYEVFLKKEALQDIPTLTSAQYDQHGDLGSTIRYNLQLERLAKTEQAYALRILNFPEEIRFAFIDPKTQARMTTIKFSDQESIRTVDFEVSIPEKLDPTLIDTNVEFTILVARPREMEAVHTLRQEYADTRIPPDEIAKIKGSLVELILIPKGVGKLDILAGNLFKEVQQQDHITLKFSAMNSGTLAVTRVTPRVDLPLEWESELTPRQAPVIDPDQKVLFTLDITTPPDVEVGDYTINVETEGHCGVELIEAPEKDFTVRVAAKGNITATIVLVGLLVALVFGIAIASIKIARR